MARTVIDDSPTTTVVDDRSGPALGVMVGVILAIAAVVLGILFVNGTFRDKSPSGGTTTINNTTTGGGGSPAPAAPAQPQSTP